MVSSVTPLILMTIAGVVLSIRYTVMVADGVGGDVDDDVDVFFVLVS